MTKTFHPARALVLLPLLYGCGADDRDSGSGCVLGTQDGCSGGQVCEEVEGSTPACFDPVSIKGRVVEAIDPAVGIADSDIVLRDASGEVISERAVSDADGRFELRLPAVRHADGHPTLPEFTLRASAAGFVTFPGGLRLSLPIDTNEPRQEVGRWVVENESTNVALDALPGSAEYGSVSGTIRASGAAGTLVVAGSSSGIAASDGSYRVFNVAPGAVEVRGYKAGLALEPASVSVASARDSVADLGPSAAPLGRVQGSLNFVNAGAKQTSVVLVVEETFNGALLRGEVPIGLRAPLVTGPYVFEGVPAGNYVVLAAFENDELVRDPDTAIGGTAVQHIEVNSETVDVPGFKITGALRVVSPGASEVETISGTPEFVWADDSSEDGYELTVLDGFGNELWKRTDLPSVSGASEVSQVYEGPALESGYYQFRAVSFRSPKAGERTYISATEDLSGVFVVP
jgi:hypothetical protein